MPDGRTAKERGVTETTGFPRAIRNGSDIDILSSGILSDLPIIRWEWTISIERGYVSGIQPAIVPLLARPAWFLF